MIKAKIKPIRSGRKLVSDALISPDKTSFAIFPNINGTTIKKENRADFSLSIPRRTAVEIVAPEREIPGKIAMACDIPIIKASFIPTFFSDIFD